MPFFAAFTAAWMWRYLHRGSSARLLRRAAFDFFELVEIWRISFRESGLQTTSDGPDFLYFGTFPTLWFGKYDQRSA